jgi:heme-degrading monooxygenase HmoA
MNDILPSPSDQRVYRVDKFIVPEPARDEFVSVVESINVALRKLPGFVQDLVLEKTTGQGEFNIVTIAVWENARAIEAAQKTMQAHYAETGFDRKAFLTKLGIKADMANDQLVGAESALHLDGISHD